MWDYHIPDESQEKYKESGQHAKKVKEKLQVSWIIFTIKIKIFQIAMQVVKDVGQRPQGYGECFSDSSSPGLSFLKGQ